MGEADVRMSVVDQRLRSHMPEELRLIVWVSIDTDQLPIGMHDAAMEAHSGPMESKGLRTVLAMRQRGSSVVTPCVLGVCFSTLHSEVMRMMEVSPQIDSSRLFGLVTMAMAMGGCDFVKTVAPCASLLDAAISVARRHREDALLLPRLTPIAALSEAIRRILAEAAKEEDHKARDVTLKMQQRSWAKKRKQALLDTPYATVLRACWTRMYWDASLRKHAVQGDALKWGFGM